MSERDNHFTATIQVNLCQPDTGQPVSARTRVKTRRILLEQSFTARMNMLMPTGAFGLLRCYSLLNGVTYIISVLYLLSENEIM